MKDENTVIITVTVIIILFIICVYTYDEHFINITLPTYLISLDKDKERREKILKIFMPTHIYAHNGENIDINFLKEIGVLDKNSTLTRGEIGCYLSHKHMLEIINNSDSDYAIIFEDDAYIKNEEEFNDNIKYIIDNANNFDWDLIFLDSNYFKLDEKNEIFKTQQFEFQKITYLHGTQCILVNNKNKINLTEKIKKLFPITIPIDITYPTIFTSYVINPHIIGLIDFDHTNTQSIR